jgi:hypothetical protein
MSTADTATTPDKKSFRLADLFGDLELVIAILLGIVSIATAYASFQGALYDGQSGDKANQAIAESTEAESLYLEGNQQFMQDTQIFNDLSVLQVAINQGDALAQEQYDQLYFQGVSEDFGAAIDRAAAQTEADPEFFYSPLDDEEYQAVLFTPYADKLEASEATKAEAEELGNQSDKLTLYTVLMAISLFLLGIAALVKRPRTQYVLVGTGVVISAVSIVLMLLIPFVGL